MQNRDHAPRRTWVLEIGGSHVTAAAVDTATGVVDSVQGAIDGGADREALLDAITRPALTALAHGNHARIDEGGWTVAIPGPFDYSGGIGRFADVGKFDSLRDVDVRAELSARLRTPPHRIGFLNDAHAYAIGEWAFGDDERVDRMVCLTLGTGVGSAFLDRGVPTTAGPLVPRNGEVLHLTCEEHPLEDVVSTRAITAAYARITGRASTVKEIAECAADGDREARVVLNVAMRALGATLAPWLARFGATRLVVGGSMVRSWELLEPPLRRALDHSPAELSGLTLRASVLLDHAPLLGAAHWRHQQPNRYSIAPFWSDHQ